MSVQPVSPPRHRCRGGRPVIRSAHAARRCLCWPGRGLPGGERRWLHRGRRRPRADDRTHCWGCSGLQFPGALYDSGVHRLGSRLGRSHGRQDQNQIGRQRLPAAGLAGSLQIGREIPGTCVPSLRHRGRRPHDTAKHHLSRALILAVTPNPAAYADRSTSSSSLKALRTPTVRRPSWLGPPARRPTPACRRPNRRRSPPYVPPFRAVAPN